MFHRHRLLGYKPSCNGSFRRTWIEFGRAPSLVAVSFFSLLQFIEWDYLLTLSIDKHGIALFFLLTSLKWGQDWSALWKNCIVFWPTVTREKGCVFWRFHKASIRRQCLSNAIDTSIYASCSCCRRSWNFIQYKTSAHIHVWNPLVVIAYMQLGSLWKFGGAMSWISHHFFGLWTAKACVNRFLCINRCNGLFSHVLCAIHLWHERRESCVIQTIVNVRQIIYGIALKLNIHSSCDINAAINPMRCNSKTVEA